jgi:hypothetical protein
VSNLVAFLNESSIQHPDRHVVLPRRPGRG